MADAEVIRIDDRSHGAAPRDHAACRGTTAAGRPCRNPAVAGSDYCRVHLREDPRTRHPSQARSSSPLPSEALAPTTDETTDDLTRILDFFKRRLSGDYPIDDFGYDAELSREVLLPLVKPLYERYFRVRTLGIERIPAQGPALLVGNHSGTIPLDAVMVQYAVASEHANQRIVRNIAADLALKLPVIGPLARKAGNALACEEDAAELLARGELVGVFPEGFKGVGKGWRERYRLQRFGRGGFIEVALRTKTPIIPVAIVGAEEAYPMIANAKFLAQALGFPYFPVTPTFPLLGPLGLLPLPSRWLIEFGEPIPMDDYPDDAAEDAMLVFDLADSIRDTIQQMLFKNVAARGPAFF